MLLLIVTAKVQHFRQTAKFLAILFVVPDADHVVPPTRSCWTNKEKAGLAARFFALWMRGSGLLTREDILLYLALCGLDSLCGLFEHLGYAVVLLVLHVLWEGVRPESLLV